MVYYCMCPSLSPHVLLPSWYSMPTHTAISTVHYRLGMHVKEYNGLVFLELR